MPTMTSSPQLLIHGHRQSTKPIVVHHPNSKYPNENLAALSSCELPALEPPIDSLPRQSTSVFASCQPHCADDRVRTVITYELAEPRRSLRWSPQEWHALEYKVPRPRRTTATRGTDKRSTATPSSDDGRIELKRVRTPPPAPKPQRLPTPDLSDLECDIFCSCCKSSNGNAQLVKAKSRRTSDIKSRKGMMWKQNTCEPTS